MKKWMIGFTIALFLIPALLTGCGEAKIPLSQYREDVAEAFRQGQTKLIAEKAASYAEGESAALGKLSAEKTASYREGWNKALEKLVDEKATAREEGRIEGKAEGLKQGREIGLLEGEIIGFEKGWEAAASKQSTSGSSCRRNYSPSSPYSSYSSNWFTGYVYQGENFNQFVGTLEEEASIDYYWVEGGPCGLNDYFSIRWQGNIYSESGYYLFSVKSDDGVRLWLDGNCIVDKWYPQIATTYTARRYISQGYHAIKLEYFERDGQAMISLNWQKE